jgi:hypothetical protein
MQESTPTNYTSASQQMELSLFHNLGFKIFTFIIKIVLNLFKERKYIYKVHNKILFYCLKLWLTKHYCNMFKYAKQFARLQKLMTLEYSGYSS